MSGLDKRWELSERGWEEQFSQEGFVFIRGVVEPELCRQAMDRVRQIVPGLPDDPRTWESPAVPTLHTPYFGEVGQSDPGLDKIIDAPGLQHAIERLFGGPGRYNGQKNYYLFLRPFDPKAKQGLTQAGHIDFGNQPIPALYRGFVVQLMLHDSEPFAGNLTLHPGTHKVVQKLVMDNPSVQFKSGMVPDLVQPPPVEFVGKAGDICLMHHLVFHSGNASHAAGRTPRVAMMIEAFSSQWLESIDPATPGLSGWERSLAHNGPYREHADTLAASKARRAEYYEKITKKE
jgi:hypothetical protein